MRPTSVEAILELHSDIVVREIEMLDGSVQGALFGPTIGDGDIETSVYRYALWRIWSQGGRYLVALMLNPSVATHVDDDNTVDRMTTRAFRLGYDGLLVINAFAWRDTLPSEMRKAEDPIGPANDDVIDLVVDEAAMVLCGWGGNGNHMGRAPALARRLEKRGVALHSLGTIGSGHPEHPLYVSYSRKPVPWSASSLQN